jgi:hypothetical protein
MKILIAEDQPPAALFLKRSLERMGHEPIAIDTENSTQVQFRQRDTIAIDASGIAD